MSFDDFDDEEDLVQPRGPVRVFSRRHPLGNPAEVEAFLEQGERWVTALGPVDIDDMTPAHALNTVQLVLENAQRIAVVLKLSGSYIGGSRYGIADDADARKTLLGTALVEALLARAIVSVETRPSWAR